MDKLPRHLLKQLADLATQLSAIVDQLSGPKAVVTPEVAARRDKMLAEKRCLLCGEIKSGKYTRGQCATCYQDTIQKIKQKLSTVKSVIERGLWTPEPSSGGRKRKGPSVVESDTPDIKRLARVGVGKEPPSKPQKVGSRAAKKTE